MRLKKMMITACCAVMCTTMLFGCGTTKSKSDTESTSETKTVDLKSLPDYPDYKASDYVDLGDYKNIDVKVGASSIITLTDDMVTKQMKSLLKDETVDRAAKSGDIVNIDYVGKMDGKEFEGGSATDYDLRLGSKSFVDDFEDQLVGCKAGDKKEVSVTFPEDYNIADMRGKDAVFTVTVNSVKQEKELNDKNVKADTDYDTVDDLKSAVKEKLQEKVDANNMNVIDTAIENKLLETVTVKSIPDSLKDWYVSCNVVAYENAALQSNQDVNEFVAKQTQGMYTTLDDLTKSFEENCEKKVKVELILQAIVEDNQITISSDEYKKDVADYIANYGCKNQDELHKIYRKSNVEGTMLDKKALAKMKETANIVTCLLYTSPSPRDTR